MVSECRAPWCSEDSRDDGQDAFANKFCSFKCEVKYDKRRMDAEECRANELKVEEGKIE